MSRYAPPENYSYDEKTGLYYEAVLHKKDDGTQEHVINWFHPDKGEFAQRTYPVMQEQMKKKSKGPLIALIVVILVVIAGIAVFFFRDKIFPTDKQDGTSKENVKEEKKEDAVTDSDRAERDKAVAAYVEEVSAPRSPVVGEEYDEVIQEVFANHTLQSVNPSMRYTFGSEMYRCYIGGSERITEYNTYTLEGNLLTINSEVRGNKQYIVLVDGYVENLLHFVSYPSMDEHLMLDFLDADRYDIDTYTGGNTVQYPE